MSQNKHIDTARKLALSLKTNATTGLTTCLGLSAELFELGMAGEMPVADFKSAMAWVSENILPDKPEKDSKAHEKAAFQARNMLYRRAVMVAFTLAGLKPNHNPFSLKDKAVMLPGKVAGSELGGTFSITKAAQLCGEYHRGPVVAVDAVKKAAAALAKLLFQAVQQFLDETLKPNQ